MIITKDKYLSDQELTDTKRILATFCGRDSAIIKLALATGARASELLAITIADLDDANQSVYIRGLKNSRDRWIPLAPELYAEIKGHVPFGIKYDRLDDIWRLYRPVDKSFHCLRHTFAINLYRRSRDMKLVQLALGHKSLTSTMVYVDFVYSQEELRKRILEVV